MCDLGEEREDALISVAPERPRGIAAQIRIELLSGEGEQILAQQRLGALRGCLDGEASCLVVAGAHLLGELRGRDVRLLSACGLRAAEGSQADE